MDKMSMLQTALWLFLFGGGLSIILGRFSRKVAIYASGILGVIAACFGVGGSVSVLLEQHGGQLSLSWLKIPFANLNLTVDPLAAFFILLIFGSAIPISLYSIGYLQSEYGDRPAGVLGALYHWFLLSMLLVVTAGNALLFLVFWECRALLSFFLVVFDTTSQPSQRAGFLYLLMIHVGTAFILIFFLLLWQHSGSLDFSAFMTAKATIPAGLKPLLVIFALIGFGAKAGLIPLHIWLPEAHPAAPSHISGLMSGVMIKTAPYEGTYACLGRVDQFLPVDFYIPGDPPTPREILEGLLQCKKMLLETGYEK